MILSTELNSLRFNLSPFTKDYRELSLPCALYTSFWSVARRLSILKELFE